MVVKKRQKNTIVFAFVAVLFAQLFFTLIISTIPAKAAGTAEWVDNATVRYDGRLFRDTKIDNDWHFFALTDGDDCKDEIDDMSYSPNSQNSSGSRTPSDNKVTYSRNGAEGGSCGTLSTDEDITLTSPANAQFGFRWVNSGLIVSADERRQFRFDQGESLYINSTNEDDVCRDIITAGANKGSVSLVVKRGRTADRPSDTDRRERLRDDYNGYTFVEDIDYDKETNNGACIASDPVTVKVAETSKANLPPGSDEDGLDTSGGAGTPEAATCESEGWQLSWILCPVLYLGDATIRKLDQALESLLSVPNDYFDEAKNPELKEAWIRLRNIAYILLVPIILVMVISTALGFELVNAYTVKKALPRFIAATIFIALSFEITKFLIILANNVGTGINGLIIGAFTGRDAESINLAAIFSPDASGVASDSIIGAGIFTAALAGGAAVGSIGIILSYIFVALIALAVGFFLLSLRQMLLIALMLLAPLAILAWIFPGNDKLWKLWWGTFSKLLLLFPLIMVLIAVGKSFATMVAVTDESFVSTLLKLVAYVGPYFLIPAMFKFAGGIFATVAGIANDRNRGIFDRQKKYRQARGAQNWQDTRNFNRFKGSNALSRRASNIAGYASNANRAGLNPARWRGRMSAAGSDMSIGQRDAMLDDDNYKAWKGNDGLNKAAAASRNESDLRKLLRDSGDYNGTDGAANMERDVARVERMRRQYGTSAFRQATWLQAMSGGTAYKEATDGWEAAADIAGGDNAVLADLVAKGRSASMGAGRIDQGGAGFMDTMRIAQQFRGNPGYTRDEANAQLTSNVIDAQGGGSIGHGSMKKSAIQNLTPALKGRIDQATSSGDERRISQALASTAGLLDAMGSSSPQNAATLADGLMGQRITINGVETTISTAIEDRRNDPQFKQMRREYGRGDEAEAARRGRPPEELGTPPGGTPG